MESPRSLTHLEFGSPLSPLALRDPGSCMTRPTPGGQGECCDDDPVRGILRIIKAKLAVIAFKESGGRVFDFLVGHKTSTLGPCVFTLCKRSLAE